MESSILAKVPQLTRVLAGSSQLSVRPSRGPAGSCPGQWGQLTLHCIALMSVARGNCLPPVTQCVLKRDGHGNSSSSSGGGGKGAWHWHWHRTSVVPARIRSSALRPSTRSRSPGSQQRHGPTGSLRRDAAADAPHHAEDAGGGGKSKTRGYSRRGGQFCCGGVSQTAGDGEGRGRGRQAFSGHSLYDDFCRDLQVQRPSCPDLQRLNR